MQLIPQKDIMSTDKEFEKLWLKHEGAVSSILAEWPHGLTSIYKRQRKLKLKEKYPEVIEKRQKNKVQREESNTRGPKRERLKGREIGDWLCVEEWTGINSHKWKCKKCGRIRYTSKSCIKNTKDCKC
jgi:hypothetical protein